MRGDDLEQRLAENLRRIEARIAGARERSRDLSARSG